MLQAPFPDPGPDDAEPGGYPPVGEDGPGPEQGLYVTLPAEQLTLSGFNQGGASDTMAPGALLATVVHTVTGEDGAGLAGLSDDQLMGIISAARRLESRSAWTLARAWPPWSPSPSHSRPCKAGPAPPAKPTGSARWTATTPATWLPPQPDTPAPAGASPP